MVSPGRLLVYKDLYLLKTNSCQNLLNWKTLVKKVHIRYKQCRNILSTLLKKVNNFILPDFFKKTLKNLKLCGVE